MKQKYHHTIDFGWDRSEPAKQLALTAADFNSLKMLMSFSLHYLSKKKKFQKLPTKQDISTTIWFCNDKI